MSIATPTERREANAPASAPARRTIANGDPPTNNLRTANRIPNEKPTNWPLGWARTEYWTFTGDRRANRTHFGAEIGPTWFVM